MLKQERINAATISQQRAADPTTSVWLAANAGTGKTTVLVQRIIRLLMHDVTLVPSKILALTYSKAAAREMSERLFREVQKRVQQPAAEREKWLSHTLTRTATPDDINAFLQLPERLNLHPVSTLTLHGFCQRILQRFPLESGLQPGFVLWEVHAQTEALKHARSNAIRALSQPTHPDYWAFIWLVGQLGEGALNNTVQAYIYERDKINAALKNTAGGSFDDRLRMALTIAPEATVTDLIQELDTQISVDKNVIAYVQNHLDTLQSGGANAKKWAVKFTAMLGLENAAQDMAWEDLFLKSGQPASWHNFITKAIQADIPDDFEAVLCAEQERLMVHQNRLKSIRSYLNTSAFVAVGNLTESMYSAHKKSANALDFNDLISHAAALLNNADISDWVRYRLDGGVQHILLDETQDTNLTQWSVVEALTADFYTGADQHDSDKKNPRTLFAVGDFKQSIYRFQGAESAVFSAIKQPLLQAKEIGYSAITDGMLSTSFRSVPAVLSAVDDVFNHLNYAQKLTPHTDKINHISTRVGEPGHVEIWPPVTVEKTEPVAPWIPAHKRENSEKANTLLCADIAAEIRRLLDSNAPDDQLIRSSDTADTPASARPVMLSDIMLIIRTRTVLGTLTAELSAAGIPFTTVQNPLEALEHPVVADVLALLKFIARPNDDVALLSVLRSPLFGWSNAQILALLKSKTEDASLWQNLPNGAEKTTLINLLEQTYRQNPYAVLVTLNNVFKLAQTLAVNLGGGNTAWQETNAHVTAFFTVARTFMARQNTGHLTLALFIDHLENTGLDVVTPAHTGTVRILTAHGAKGLEAPIVFIVDGARDMFSQMKHEHLIWDNDESLFLQRQGSADAPSIQLELDNTERERILQDELRLLYVAMTRAEERLYICAASRFNADKLMAVNDVTQAPNNWWGIVASAAVAEKWAEPDTNRWLKTDPDAQPLLPHNNAPMIENSAPEPFTPPPWLMQTYRLVAHTESEQSAAQQRGENIHKALELWPIPIETLQNMFPDDTAAAQSILATVAEHSWLFGENSQAEVPVMMNGQKKIIDRLVIDENSITIADFKTDAVPPKIIPREYQQQLRTYVNVIQQLYPDYAINAGILWVNDRPMWQEI